MMAEKLCRIQAETKIVDGRRINCCETFIPWWLAEEAYKFYNCKDLQSLEKLNERGGFGRGELLALLRREPITLDEHK